MKPVQVEVYECEFCGDRSWTVRGALWHEFNCRERPGSPVSVRERVGDKPAYLLTDEERRWLEARQEAQRVYIAAGLRAWDAPMKAES